MKQLFYVCIFFISSNLFCQKNEIAKYRIFYSIKETETVNADSVLNLNLGNNSLTEFPDQLLKFKNLTFITFYNRNNGEIFHDTPWLLSEEEKQEVENIFKQKGNIRTDVHGVFRVKNKTKIKTIPGSIVELKFLNTIILDKKEIKNNELKKLQKLLPNCYITAF